MSRGILFWIVVLVFGTGNVLVFNNCSPGFDSISSKKISSQGLDGNGVSGISPSASSGSSLYEKKCAACHGPLITSTKLGADFSRIKSAILDIPQMASLSALTDKEVEAIAEALKEGAKNDTVACESAPDVGTVTMRRLNQFEYRNTIRSLTGVQLAPDSNFPTEENGEFPNNGRLLILNEQQFSWYMKTAAEVVNSMIDQESTRANAFRCFLTEEACWKKSISDFAARAYRRPASQDELNRLFAAYQKEMTQGSKETVASLKIVLSGILLTPQFLYRNVNLSRPNDSAAKQALSQYEIATRMAYFIWGDQPDAQLFARASKNELSDAAVVKTEVLRMLADPRAGRNFGMNFFDYWMGTVDFSKSTPDQKVFPEFNESIRSSMKQETEKLFEEIVSTNRPLSELLTAEYSFLDERLAKFYGIPGVSGSNFVKTSLAGTNRVGALTHGSFLTVTSHSGGTSIVRRGGFIARRLQCIEVKSPPEGASTLPPPDGSKSIRDRLEYHRSIPQCASCHNIMDPPGFGLESFNAVGNYRTKDEEGFPLDTTGTLFDGSSFTSARELASILGNSEEFHRCGVSKMVTFALGRVLEDFDKCTVEKIKNRTKGKPISDVITEIILSDPFQYERGG